MGHREADVRCTEGGSLNMAEGVQLGGPRRDCRVAAAQTVHLSGDGKLKCDSASENKDYKRLKHVRNEFSTCSRMQTTRSRVIIPPIRSVDAIELPD